MAHHALASKCTIGRFPPSVQRELDNMLTSVTERYDVSFFFPLKNIIYHLILLYTVICRSLS